jgi:hypothetical protein
MLTLHGAQRPPIPNFPPFVPPPELGGAAPVQWCPVCGELLDLSQPNTHDPDRLVGFCEPEPRGDGCGSLFCIEGFGDPDRAMRITELLHGSASASKAKCPTEAAVGIQ